MVGGMVFTSKGPRFYFWGVQLQGMPLFVVAYFPEEWRPSSELQPGPSKGICPPPPPLAGRGVSGWVEGSVGGWVGGWVSSSP